MRTIPGVLDGLKDRRSAIVRTPSVHQGQFRSTGPINSQRKTPIDLPGRFDEHPDRPTICAASKFARIPPEPVG